jgi:hypothetical protein
MKAMITDRACAPSWNPTEDEQRALAVFAADPHAGLDDGWENQHRGRLGHQLARATDAVRELPERRVDVGVDPARGIRLAGGPRSDERNW